MQSILVARRLLVPAVALLAALSGCSPSPSPSPATPPAPTVAPVVAPAASSATPAPPPQKQEIAQIDYGSPPKAPCIQRAAAPRPPVPRSPVQRQAQRHALAGEILQSGALYVELDARKPGVVVPPGYEKVGRLVLVVGHALPQPIPDLVVDADGVSGQLLFKGQRFPVRVPWSAVYGLMNRDEDVSRWLEDVPDDVLCPETRPPAEGG